MREGLLGDGILESEVLAIEEDIRKTVADSITFAMNSAYPKKETLYTDLYAF